MLMNCNIGFVKTTIDDSSTSVVFVRWIINKHCFITGVRDMYSSCSGKSSFACLCKCVNGSKINLSFLFELNRDWKGTWFIIWRTMFKKFPSLTDLKWKGSLPSLRSDAETFRGSTLSLDVPSTSSEFSSLFNGPSSPYLLRKARYLYYLDIKTLS